MPYDAKKAASELPKPGPAMDDDMMDGSETETADPECVAAYQEFESAKTPEAKALALKHFVQMYAGGV